jgi:membrane protease YdiL (CAAX protease family)
VFGGVAAATYPGTVPESDQVQPRGVRPLPPPPPEGATGDGSGPVDARGWARWGIFTSLVGWLVGLVGGAIAFQLVLTASGTHIDDADSLGIGWVAVAQLGLWVGLLGAPWFYSRLKGNGMRRDYALRATWRDVPIGGLWGLAGQYAIVSLVYIPMSWFVDISRDEFSEPAREMTDRATDPVGVVLLVLIVGIGAPIVEEIFYRGLLQRSLTTLLGPVWAIAIASLVFGAVHFQLLQLPALTLAGVLFGVLAHRYGRLGPAIAAHMVFNLTAVTVLVLTS